ncbi:MFS transporter [Nocardioides sp.]|jgi:MFS family permease|uniref:MFS transporter n=1 Tax=Nocardioides sp. TaxID=35761 RepID=UPI002F3FF85A
MADAVADTRDWQGWRTVLWLGVVSLLVDLVYEGARSITGPFLASLGASALTVGLVTGAGEAAALGFRVFSGPAADRTGRYWRWMVIGYALTAVCVPLMALAPALGAAGLAFGAAMVLLERTGKAIRSPAKSVLLAVAARNVGRGRGFGVHKALDQTGAFLGPLLVAVVVAVTSHQWAGLLVLAVPGAVALGVLAWMHRYVGDPQHEHVPAGAPLVALPGTFYVYAVACSLTTMGLMTFGVISFHLVNEHLVTAAVVPVVYAAAMGADALASLGTGFAYDHVGGGTLLLLPVVVAFVPALVFTDRVGLAVTGVLLWGAATGVQDSTVKALVADLVPAARLATAYGAFAAFQAVAALSGGALAGWLYDGRRDVLVVAIGVAQAVALVLLLGVLVRRRHRDKGPTGPG